MQIVNVDHDEERVAQLFYIRNAFTSSWMTVTTQTRTANVQAISVRSFFFLFLIARAERYTGSFIGLNLS